MFSLYRGCYDADAHGFPTLLARPVPKATLQEWATRPGRILARLLSPACLMSGSFLLMYLMCVLYCFVLFYVFSVG